ncbi:MAG: 2OG-Fe(II) oxygenase, partial [Rhodospirillaceae bacterium]|nr:2OG-Fe(II) oxygenase [Rhodospirillaceae bacterium]
SPYKSDHALIFVPSPDTWHGYEKRPMAGIRKNLIVNYVTDEWRARHELCFPDDPIGKAA